jgi:hypothetical protein
MHVLCSLICEQGTNRTYACPQCRQVANQQSASLVAQMEQHLRRAIPPAKPLNSYAIFTQDMHRSVLTKPAWSVLAKPGA